MSRRAPAEGRARAGGDESPAGGSGPLPSNYEALISRMEYVGNRWAIKGPRCRPFTNQLSLVSTRVNSLQWSSEPSLRAYGKRPSRDYYIALLQRASSSTQSGDLTKSMHEMNISQGAKLQFGSFPVVM